MRTYKRLRTNQTMAVENEYREEDQNVTENVNVSEADNQPEYVNVDSTVAEANNLAMVRYVPQNNEHIQQTENVAQNEHALDNEDLDQYLVYPRNTWAYDITITVHCKLKFFDNIKRVLKDQGELALFKKECFGHYLDLPEHMRGFISSAHVPDRPDLEPSPLDETHSPLHHHSLGGTQSEVQSSGDNHKTSSPNRLCQPPPPSVDRRQHSKRSERRSRGEDCAEHVSDSYSPSNAFEAANRGYDADHTKGSAHTKTALVAPPPHPHHTDTHSVALTHPETIPVATAHIETAPTHTETHPTAFTHPETIPVATAHTKTAPAYTKSPPTHTETPHVALTQPETILVATAHIKTAPTHTKTPPAALTHPETIPVAIAHTETHPAALTYPKTIPVATVHIKTAPAHTVTTPVAPTQIETAPAHTETPPTP
ncbi:hypothetical protein LWI28_003205 [Acer negundo]|uniref:Uncharacterized protein n=1 Tax=Acer negundo TaxID=4023 RepID=A0AAD5I4Y0_ACENE|nr:hypothetical protein LWI28_003205 [Acer negundo]